MSAAITFDRKEWEVFINSFLKNATDPGKNFLSVAFNTAGIRDIVQHFDDERGPDGRWAPWTPEYKKRRYASAERRATKRARAKAEAKGKPVGALEKILQLTGTLRKSVLPANLRNQQERRGRTQIAIYSPVEYSGQHDEGDPKKNLPQREFMWISDKAQEAMANIVLNLAIEGRA